MSDGPRTELSSERPGLAGEGELEALGKRVAELEAELEASRRLACIGATMRGLAHSVRSALALCRAANHMVDRAILRWERDEVERAWEMMKRSSSRTAELVAALLDPERAGSLAPRPGDPDAVVREAAEVASEQASDQGDELVLDLGGDLEGACFDPQAFRRCLTELLSNALDALAEAAAHGRVTVSTRRGRSSWTLRVADDGPGMSPEHLERALRGGFTSKGAGGSGLGLAQVRELVRQHGGRLEVTSTPGAGTTASCTFPLELAARSAGEAAPSRGPGPEHESELPSSGETR